MGLERGAPALIHIPDLRDAVRSYFGSRLLSVPRGNPSPKIAITVDPDVHAQIVEAAATDGVSVSAWITQAARHALKLRDGRAAIAEWEAEHGAFTDEELAAARREIAEAETAARMRRSA